MSTPEFKNLLGADLLSDVDLKDLLDSTGKLVSEVFKEVDTTLKSIYMEFNKLGSRINEVLSTSMVSNPKVLGWAHQTLGTDQYMSDGEVRTAYVELAKENHPDRGGDEEAMKRINLAYSIIKKRRGI